MSCWDRGSRDTHRL